MTAAVRRHTVPADHPRLAEQLRSAAAESRFVAATIAAPIANVASVAHALPGEHRSLWSSPRGLAQATCGLAAQITATNPANRFSELASRGAALLASIHHTDGPEPVLFGGFSFDPGPAPARRADPRWAEFGAAQFRLPRWRYSTDGHSAWLTAIAAPGDDSVLSELDDVWSALFAPFPQTTTRRRGPLVEQPQAAWTPLVENILGEITNGRVGKIALARRSDLPVSGTEPFALAAALAKHYPTCHLFAVEGDGASFIGATPESLIKRRDRDIESQALAGSIAASQPRAAETLLASSKDRAEQDVVVQAIAERLRPYCTELRVGERPVIRELRDVLHLHTDIRGTLREPTHVLDLCAELHPTPAVGGYPRGPALDWLRQHEPLDRGWYAAPVGWFDVHGNGSFAVAIRSAMVERDRVSVFAGAGIVADSRPDAEYAETGLKQRAVLGVL